MKIAELCKETGEPVYLTVEEERLNGNQGYSTFSKILGNIPR
jgi:hypothetical protein